MAALLDNFTGGAADLASHVSDSGNGWTSIGSVGGGTPSTYTLTGSGAVYSSGTGGFVGIYWSNWTPASANYFVEVTWDNQTSAGEVGVMLRGNGGTTDQDATTGYMVRYAVGSGYQCFKNALSNSYTQIGSNEAGPGVPADGDTMRVEISGSSTTSIALIVNGSLVQTFTDSTSPYTSAGSAGVWGAGGLTSSTGLHFSQLTADDSVALTAGTASATAMTSTGGTFACTAAAGGTPNYTYQLQRGTDGVTFGTNVGSPQTVAGAPTPQADSGATGGTQYYWRWNITDAAAGDVDSNTVTIVPHAAGHYYFDFTNGSDGNNGTTTVTAWKTPVKYQAFLNFTAADDIASLQNTMTGNFRVVAAPGTSGHPVTINAFGTGGTIDADDSYGFWLDECKYTTVNGLTLTGSGVSSGGVTTSTGPGVRASLAGAADLTDVKVTNCTISGFGTYGILYDVADAATEEFVTPAVTGNTVSECRIAGITLKHGTNGISTQHDLSITDATVSGNTVSLIYGDGSNNTGYGIQAVNWDGGTVSDNYVHNCGEASGSAPGGPVGIITVESDGVVIEDNEVAFQFSNENYDGEGVDCDGGSRNCIVQFNYLHDNDGPAYMDLGITGFTQNDGNIFRFNVCQNNGRRTHGTAGSNPATAFSLYEDITNSQVYNNTFFDENDTGAETKSIYDNSTSGAVVRDNIFILSGSGRTVGVIAASTVLNPNRYYAINSAAISGTDGGTPFADFAALQGLGQEAGGSSGDPALEDIGNAGSGYPLGNFSTLTEYDPTTSAIWDGGSNIQSYSGPDFHGNTMPTPVTGEYPLGAVGFAASGARRRRVLMGAA